MHQPKNAGEMWQIWIAEVQTRSANLFEDDSIGATAKEMTA